MIIRPVQVSFLAIIAAFLSSFAFAHPVPDIPVRTFFPGDGTARVTVEIDPRCFEPDPENAPSLVPHGFSKTRRGGISPSTLKLKQNI